MVVALGGVAAVLWFVWMPEYRPALRAGERYGVDVSAHQGDIDWPQVAADDIEFAYIKATEGGTHTDVRFQENWDGAARAGLDRGAYHFFTLCTPGAVQARHFLSVVPQTVDGLPPAVDLELEGNCKRRPADDRVRSEVDAFVAIVEDATGQQVLVYLGDEFERRYPTRERLARPLWHPRFLRRPDVRGWLVWQVSGFAHVDGVHGDVDLDVMRRSR